MKFANILGAAVLSLSALAPAQTGGENFSSKSWNFDSDAVGRPPAGFSFGRTGEGAEGQWVVRAEADAPSKSNVLAQVSTDETDNRFPVAFTDLEMKDVRLSVKCKPVSGNVDRSCGLVFRLKDPDNYYVVRANALENNVHLYRVVKGCRRQFAGWDGKVASGVWHDLEVETKDDHIQVFFDNNLVIDSHDKTFPEAGKVGLWTKADSVTYFGNLIAMPL
jgi:hypothetical protein